MATEVLECPDCHGHMTLIVCRTCNGTGRIELELPPSWCMACGHRVEPTRDAACPACGSRTLGFSTPGVGRSRHRINTP